MRVGRQGVGEEQQDIESTVGDHGIDLLIASGLIGGAHGIGAGIRLRNEERAAVRRGDMWIAALNSLVVLGLSASLLLLAVLNRFADEHASMANRGYPVVLLWAGLQTARARDPEIGIPRPGGVRLVPGDLT